MADPTNRLLELDERHNELLEQLAVLDRHVSSILDDWTRTRQQREQNESIDQALDTEDKTVEEAPAVPQAA